jgi:hypothetical protein
VARRIFVEYRGEFDTPPGADTSGLQRFHVARATFLGMDPPGRRPLARRRQMIVVTAWIVVVALVVHAA